jgi:hypothetical protein
MASVFSLVFLDRGIPNVSARAGHPFGGLLLSYGNSIYHATLVIIAIRLERGQGGAAKKLWGSPTEQTRVEMLAVEVEHKPRA